MYRLGDQQQNVNTRDDIQDMMNKSYKIMYKPIEDVKREAKLTRVSHQKIGNFLVSIFSEQELFFLSIHVGQYCRTT